MISRKALVYVFAAACTALGVRMAFESRKSDGGAAAGKGKLVQAGPSSRLPGKLGGYNGTGESQVQFEDETKTVAKPLVVKDGAEVRSKEKSAGDRRMEDLKRVLSNIDNEPVYVEGVDGPAPERKPQPKR